MPGASSSCAQMFTAELGWSEISRKISLMWRGRCGAEFVDVRGKTSWISWGLGHRMSDFLAQERHGKTCGYNNGSNGCWWNWSDLWVWGNTCISTALLRILSRFPFCIRGVGSNPDNGETIAFLTGKLMMEPVEFGGSVGKSGSTTQF